MDFEVSVVDDLPCHRCGDTLICSVRVPHSFLREDGVEVRGMRTVGLCPNCAGDNPAARVVIDHFRAGSRLLDIAVPLGEWLSEVLPAQVDVAQLAGLRAGAS
ncbi:MULTISPECIES: DUF6300 family protein [unclassified Nocardia]|uniref:DUF6300 family protein n=1 Tax=unclassified Nocardia TaxID=2637762 RepID=UPI001CE3C12E|nr:MULTISPECIES: DUF6300 family protein [unclassified Nocardia]